MKWDDIRRAKVPPEYEAMHRADVEALRTLLGGDGTPEQPAESGPASLRPQPAPTEVVDRSGPRVTYSATGGNDMGRVETRPTPPRHVTPEYVRYLRDIGASDELVARAEEHLTQERRQPSWILSIVVWRPVALIMAIVVWLTATLVTLHLLGFMA